MRLQIMAAAISVLALNGCASKSDLNYLSYQVEELNVRVPKVEKDLRMLKSETKEGLEKRLEGLRGDIDTVRRASADLQANLDAVRVDMQVVSGKLDDAAVAAKRPADDLALLREDLERRLSAIDARMAKLERSLEEQQKRVPESPEAAYHKGMEAYKNGEMQASRELLTKFLAANPSHELAANAHYWLGETYYAEKKFDQAVLEFQELIKNFPNKEKVPAAMLKQAMAFKEMGDVKSARYLYKKLIDDYPASEESKTAREKLTDLK